jgi:hypothetical protein
VVVPYWNDETPQPADDVKSVTSWIVNKGLDLKLHLLWVCPQESSTKLTEGKKGKARRKNESTVGNCEGSRQGVCRLNPNKVPAKAGIDGRRASYFRLNA